jgi:hypothetical protein
MPSASPDGSAVTHGGRSEPVATADVTLSPAEQAWLEADEALWQRAHRIQLANPALDVGDLYHTLRNFQRSPAERLRRGLRDGRARTRTV